MFPFEKKNYDKFLFNNYNFKNNYNKQYLNVDMRYPKVGTKMLFRHHSLIEIFANQIFTKVFKSFQRVTLTINYIME